MNVFVREKSGQTIPLEWDEKSGEYQSKGLLPQEGVEYELGILRDGLPSVLSESIIPPAAIAQYICAEQQGACVKVNFDLLYNENIPFYSIQVSQLLMKHSLVLPILSANFEFENQKDEIGKGYTYVVVNNSQLRDKVRMSVLVSGNRMLKGSPITLCIQACSRDAGKYKSTLQQYELERLTLIHSNIKNELGIWGGYNQVKYPVAIEIPQ